MERRNRRHSTGFGYIGFGNNQNLFNQNSKKAFSELKEKLHKETLLHFELEFHHHTLSKEEKQLIKNKIRKAEKQRSLKTIAVTIILLAGVLVTINLLINQIMSRL